MSCFRRSVHVCLSPHPEQDTSSLTSAITIARIHTYTPLCHVCQVLSSAAGSRPHWSVLPYPPHERCRWRQYLPAYCAEYDNDESDPTKPYRSAQESAIFAHQRRVQAETEAQSRRTRTSSFLDVELPSDRSTRVKSGDFTQQHSRAQGSVDVLRNPFRESIVDDGEAEDNEGLEVDLTSWGLDTLLAKDKEPSKLPRTRSRSEAGILPNPHDLRPGERTGTVGHRPMRPKMGQRARSLGDFDSFVNTFEGFDSASLKGNNSRRPASLGPSQLMSAAASASFHDLVQKALLSSTPDAVPFPSHVDRPLSPESLDDVALPWDIPEDRQRTLSDATIDAAQAQQPEYSDNTFAVQPPSPSRLSRFDPKVIELEERARRQSNASRLSRPLLQDDAASATLSLDPQQQLHSQERQQHGKRRDRPYSTVELLRPKVLIMPSPLQKLPQGREADDTARAGFSVSSDGPPLPAGARTVRRPPMVLGGDSLDPPQDDSFTPNPRMNMSLSQLTFRNHLTVDGQRDVTFSDLENGLVRATEEGEQVPRPVTPEAERALAEAPVPVVIPPHTTGRAAGKLYGRSLIDDLEKRKAEMRGKQRVFRGDDRPSMMSRSQSAFIDPSTLNSRPSMPHMNSSDSQPGKRSSTLQPLVNLDNSGLRPPNNRGMPSTRSVFGVDTLWEREMTKLKEMEAEERKYAESRAAASSAKKKGNKGNKPEDEDDAAATVPQPSDILPGEELEATSPQNRVSLEPPVLPKPEGVTSRRRQPPAPASDDGGSDDEHDEDGQTPRRKAPKAGWDDSSDEETNDKPKSDQQQHTTGPRRMTGTGPRYPQGPPRLALPGGDVDGSDDEDVPLSKTLPRVVSKAMSHGSMLGVAAADSEDEDRPLSTLFVSKNADSTAALKPSRLTGADGKDGDDDDDAPLGLRASRVPSAFFSGNPIGSALAAAGGGGGSGEGADEDDKPLGFHPGQQQRMQQAQFTQQAQMMAAAAAQQQQMMMMQAQMTGSMYFANPSMISLGAPMVPMGVGANPMMGGMVPPFMQQAMMEPIPIPSPPPIQDQAKLGRVDRWRHDVAVEEGSS